MTRWPFLCLGLLTFGAWLVVERYGMPPGLHAPFRRLVIPLWGMRSLQMIVGIGYLPRPLQLVIALPTLFLPYALADWFLWRFRHRSRSRHPTFVAADKR